MHKRMVVPAIIAGAMTVIAMATPAMADKAHPVIGFTVYSMTSWVSWGKQGAEKIAASNHAELRWLSANQDVNTQVSQMQQFINQKVDAIIVAAVNSSTLGPQIAAAKAAGIPVIATNMAIKGPEQKDLVAYVGPNDVGAGEQAAKHLVEAIHGEGGIVVLQGPIGQTAESDRTQGIRNVLAHYPKVHVLAMQPGQWDRTKAYNLMQDWMSRYGTDIKGVVAENDDMAIGAIQAQKDKGILLPVTGIDAIKDGLRAVKNKTLVETNLQNAAIELGEAVQVAIDHLNGKPVPAVALLNMPEVTLTNAARYETQNYVTPKKFIEELPALVRKNLDSGDYSFE